MCGESWLATKNLQPTVPVLKAGHPGVLDSVCVCVGLSGMWEFWCLSDSSILASVLYTCSSMYMCSYTFVILQFLTVPWY